MKNEKLVERSIFIVVLEFSPKIEMNAISACYEDPVLSGHVIHPLNRTFITPKVVVIGPFPLCE